LHWRVDESTSRGHRDDFGRERRCTTEIYVHTLDTVLKPAICRRLRLQDGAERISNALRFCGGSARRVAIQAMLSYKGMEAFSAVSRGWFEHVVTDVDGR
jgi:hypothetical protein